MIHAYGLFIGIGVLIAYAISLSQAKKMRIDAVFESCFFLAFLFGVVGARLYHLLSQSDLYVRRPVLSFFAVWNGGLGVYGAIAGGIVGCIVYAVYKKLSYQDFFSVLDLTALGIPLAQIVGRLGNYVNQELYGSETSLPWGIDIGGVRHHPLFFYEMMYMTVVYVLLWALWSRRAFVYGKGQYFFVYLFLYGMVRFWLEFLREATVYVPSLSTVFSLAQIVSLVCMVGCSILFWLRRHAPKTEWELRTLL